MVAYTYPLMLQSNPQFNVPTYPSSPTPFTINTYQAVVSSGPYATPLYSWYFNGNIFKQPVATTVPGYGTVEITTMTSQVFGPSGSPTYSSQDLSVWVDNPVSTYPANYTAIASDPGPSYTFGVTDSTGFSAGAWNFNIQLAAPQDVSGTSYPITTVYGNCNYNANAFLCGHRTVVSAKTDVRYWYKIDLLEGPLGKTIPFPYIDASGNGVASNIPVVFATPYSPQYYFDKAYNAGSVAPLSGYLVAFYKDSNLPQYTYPALYDAVNLENQDNYKKVDSGIPALAWLNEAMGTTYATVNELFKAQNWLQDTTLPDTQGGSTSTGVDLGGEFGSGWYVLGLVPYNLAVPQSYQQTNQWVNSTQNVQSSFQVVSSLASCDQTIETYVFCSGNLTMASLANYQAGNVFWEALGL